MTLDSFLQFILRHNARLIETLIFLILCGALYLAYRAFKAPPEAESTQSAGINGKELEETLKKLLEKASFVPPSAEAGQSEDLLLEIEAMKKQLEDRQSEIELLKAQADAAGSQAPSMSNEEKAQLESQMKELQAKLQEYEIISEDIADLSFYKEENAKLQRQIEGMGPAASGSQSMKSGKPEPEIVGRARGSVEQEAIIENVKKPPVGKVRVYPEEKAPTSPPPPAPAAEALAEINKAVDNQIEAATAAAAEEPDLGSMDMDKMLEEAGDLGATEGISEDSNALEKSLDAEKLLQEANALTTVKSDDKQLMNEFENFVKKGS